MQSDGRTKGAKDYVKLINVLGAKARCSELNLNRPVNSEGQAEQANHHHHLVLLDLKKIIVKL